MALHRPSSSARLEAASLSATLFVGDRGPAGVSADLALRGSASDNGRLGRRREREPMDWWGGGAGGVGVGGGRGKRGSATWGAGVRCAKRVLSVVSCCSMKVYAQTPTSSLEALMALSTSMLAPLMILSGSSFFCLSRSIISSARVDI
jgi:hypothetical protein